jgi:hypothetical protein
MIDHTLILLANEVRRKTLWLLEGVTEELPPPLRPGANHCGISVVLAGAATN